MPIPVACVCGSRFAAPDNLAGRTVKCPKCQSPINIPSGAPAMAAPGAFPGQGMPSQQMPSQQMPGQQMPSQQMPGYAPGPMNPGYPAQPMVGGPSASLFDEAGLKQATAGSITCPGCNAALNPGTVVCITCGYNLKLGKRMTTINMDRPVGHGDAHGIAPAMILEKAAAAIEEEREYEAGKGK